VSKRQSSSVISTENTLSEIVVKNPPLVGFRVIDFSTMIAGPFGTSILADYGAEVIKIEPRDSCDLMRFVGSQKNGMSGIFALNNKGKRALAMNTKSDKGQEIAKKLIATADVLVHNHRHGVMESMGLGYDQLREQMPNLIYVHIVGYGETGILANNKAYDNMIQAITGMGSAQGTPPEVVHQLVCDKTGHVVAQAVIAALLARARGMAGGQKLSISMLDVATQFMWQDLGMDAALLDNDVSRSATIDKYYRTVTLKDGYCAVTPASDEEFSVWMRVLGLNNILEDERFNSIGARFANAEALIQLTDEAAKNVTVAEVENAITNDSLPAAIFRPLEELPNHPQVRENGMFYVRDHPVAGNVREARQAPRFSETPLFVSTYAPMHGEHTKEILDSLGYWARLFEEIVK
jgi:crotonobetainyl-CoA:carnitine CoA-transferase CaiB-like acyl-CoA transferase